MTHAVFEIGAADEAAWDAYVTRHSAASIYHLAMWRRVIADLYGHQAHYLCTRDTTGGAITGVLPLIRLKSLLFGDYLVSMPYFNYGGAIADTSDVEQSLMEHAGTMARRLGCSHIEFRDAATHRPGWAVRTDKVGMQLVLPATVDALWTNLGSKLRAQIKRPQREAGVDILRGGRELLNDFYEVFARNMRDLGTPVYPLAMFDAILTAFPQAASIVVVRFEGRPAAAGFVMGYRERLEIPWAASRRELNRVGFNMLLYWEILKFAIEQRYAIFDFGRSSREGGTHQFKKQWGACETPIHWHYWLAAGREMPNLTPKNAKFGFAINVWKKMPVAIANRIGPWLVGNLP